MRSSFAGIRLSQRRLLLVAPSAQRQALVTGLRAAGVDVHWHRRPRARPGTDPYRLTALARRWHGRVDAILLITPTTISPTHACPGLVVAGLTVASLPADRIACLRPWLQALPMAGRGGGWAVLAAGQHHYLGLSSDLARRLRASRRAVSRWSGDRIARSVLSGRLAQQPALALYTGHGLPEGLPAFGGLEVADWSEPNRATGTVALFSCRTFSTSTSTNTSTSRSTRRTAGSKCRTTGPTNNPGFALRLALEGRTAGVLAASTEVDRRLNTAFARRLTDQLAHADGDLAAALVALHCSQAEVTRLRPVLDAYRVIGLPFACPRPVRCPRHQRLTRLTPGGPFIV